MSSKQLWCQTLRVFKRIENIEELQKITEPNISETSLSRKHGFDK
jgi:hypothetical protein